LKRLLLRSNSFIRVAQRVSKKYLQYKQDLESTIELIAEDAFNPILKTHKLKGELEGSWS